MTSYGAEDNVLRYNISVLDVNRHSCEKNWIHILSASGSSGRLASRQMDFEIFKISYRLSYSDFYYI